MRTLLLIDGNNNAWRAFHKYKGLRNGKHKVSIIFGLPSILNGLINKFEPSRIIMVWDGSKSPHRLEVHPEYKGKRKFNPDYEEFNIQKSITQDFLHLMGIPQVVRPEVEADDYIYMLQKIYVRKGYKVIIVSSDKDFKQLVSENVSIWDGVKQKLINHKNIKEVTGFTARQSIDYLILDGDNSDNIKGYPGMGEKRLAEFFSKFRSIKQFLDSGEEFRFIKTEKLLEVVKTNTLLINLRYFYNTYLKGKIKVEYYKGNKKPTFQKEAFLKVCRKYKFNKFQQKPFLKNYETSN